MQKMSVNKILYEMEIPKDSLSKMGKPDEKSSGLILLFYKEVVAMLSKTSFISTFCEV